MRLLFMFFSLSISYFSLIMSMEDISKLNETQLTIKLYKDYHCLSIKEVASYIENGALVNYRPTSHDPTLLMMSMTRPIEHAKLLLEHKIDVNSVVNGNTALVWAMNSKDVDKVQLLLSASPKSFYLDRAVELKDVSVVSLLILYEKNEQAKIKCLQKAIDLSSLAIVDLFFKHKIYTDDMIVETVQQLIVTPFDEKLSCLFDMFCEHWFFSEKALNCIRHEIDRLYMVSQTQKVEQQNLRSSTEIVSVVFNNVHVISVLMSMRDRFEAVRNRIAAQEAI